MDSINLSRRNFLKETSKAALTGVTALSFGLLKSCAAAPPALEITKPGESLIYPLLIEGKIQPPQEGCWIGFHPSYRNYKIWLDRDPKLLVATIYHADNAPWYPEIAIKNIHERGAIPVNYLSLRHLSIVGGLGSFLHSKDFKEYVKSYARGIVRCGKKIFLTTMRELNGHWDPWSNQPKTSKALWKLMHNICRDEGANELATWFWEVYCPIPGVHDINRPDNFWPGDNYVDYIGVSAFSRDSIPITNKSLQSLIGSTVNSLHNNHKDKPIIISEFGKTKSLRQVSWLKSAYEYIKSNQIIKGAIFWDNRHPGLGDDHTLHELSFKFMRELFAKDQYFILADTSVNSSQSQ